MRGRQQFDVTLPPDLVRRLKYRAIDAQLSASHLVERLLEVQLETDGSARKETAMRHPRWDAGATSSPQLTLQPMVHVQDMAASVGFFEALGGRLVHGSRDGDYALLDIAGSALALLAHPPNPEQDQGAVEVQLTASDDVRDIEQYLRDAEAKIVTPVTDEAFGAQLQVRSPDGLLIKMNQLGPDLYT